MSHKRNEALRHVQHSMHHVIAAGEGSDRAPDSCKLCPYYRPDFKFRTCLYAHCPYKKQVNVFRSTPEKWDMVDREAKRAEGKGAGYDRWASLHNLKQMAATHNFLMENELLDLDNLDAAVESSRKALSEARESLRGIEQSISDKKNLRKVVSDYRRTRPTIDAHKKLSGKKAEAYYRANEADFIIYEAALRQLKVLAPGKKLPAISKLNTEIETLISEKNAAYNTYRTAKAEHEQLATAKRNAEQILHGTPSRQKKHEQER